MQRKGWVPCAWRNDAPVGEPPRFVVTDWRPTTGEDRKAKRAEKPVEKAKVGRGAVAASKSLFERMAEVARGGVEPMPQGRPSARRLRELDSPKRPSRAKQTKAKQGQLL